MTELTLPEARRELAQVAAEVARLKAEMAGAIYDLGVLLIDVRDRELWRAAGYPRLADCVEDALGVSRRTAFKAMELAQHFGPEIARRYGSEKLLAVHRYLKATAVEEAPGDVLAADIQVRGPGGRFVSLPLHEASARQIVDAARDLEDRRAARAARKAARAADRAERLARLSAALPAAPVRVKASRGQVTYAFPRVAEDDMPAFIAALQAEFLGRDDADR